MEAEWKGNFSVFDKVKTAAEEIENHNKNISLEEKKRKLTNNDFSFESPLDVLEENMGNWKVFPGGPPCEYDDKHIPAFVTNSESGGITPEILVDILKHLDIYGIIDQNETDSPPCLLADGNGSRLSIFFLRYINNLNADGEKIARANHEWN